MRALNKKMMTLAFATCLTVGIGAVACADTVDLGYGLYGSTSPTVKVLRLCMFPRILNCVIKKANNFLK